MKNLTNKIINVQFEKSKSCHSFIIIDERNNLKRSLNGKTHQLLMKMATRALHLKILFNKESFQTGLWMLIKIISFYKNALKRKSYCSFVDIQNCSSNFFPCQIEKLVMLMKQYKKVFSRKSNEISRKKMTQCHFH